MKVVPPIQISNAHLVASNVPEDDHPEWSGAAPYAKGAKVIVVGSSHRVFESLIDSNSDDPLGAGVTSWLDLGATNRWRAFDQKIGMQAMREQVITYSLTPDEFTNCMAFFRVQAAQIRVQVFSQGSETAVYDQTQFLVDNAGVQDHHDYFMQPVEYRTRAVFTDLPAFAGDAIEVEINAGSGTAKVGQIVMGFARDIGKTKPGTSVGIRDFSTKEGDSFGNWSIVERAYRSTIDFDVLIRPGRSGYVESLLAGLRAQPAVYFSGASAGKFGAIAYGFYKDFGIPAHHEEWTETTIEIEGLT